eukprot:GEMP01073824.1.p1 GENE.GEMP01073824.1~~GEMP01073824.1.p1  ORF type:complete len:118 (-),score=18.13 GEMP01073824.1:702-1055(-)
MTTTGLATTQWSEVIGGVPTDFIVTTFTSKLFVVITQTKRIASMVEASIENNDAANKIYCSKVIFGDRRKEYYSVYGRALIKELNGVGVTSVLMGLSLPEGTETFHAVMESLKKRFL